MDRYTWEGLEHIEGRLRECVPDIAYVTLDECVDSQQAFQADRLDLRPLERPEDAGSRIQNILEWIRRTAGANTTREQKFRFRAYSVKGGPLFSGRMVCKDESREEAPAAPPAVSWPEPAQTIEGAASQTMQAVTAAISELSKICVFNVDRITGACFKVIDRLNHSLDKRDQTIEGLVDAHTRLKLGIADAEKVHQVEVEQVRQRGRVLDRVVESAGNLSAILLQAQGIPPETKELLVELAKNPAVADKLRDPNVIKGLQNPEIRKVMLEMLIFCAQAGQHTPEPPNTPKEG